VTSKLRWDLAIMQLLPSLGFCLLSAMFSSSFYLRLCFLGILFEFVSEIFPFRDYNDLLFFYLFVVKHMIIHICIVYNDLFYKQ
jgi:hypothetical protein